MQPTSGFGKVFFEATNVKASNQKQHPPNPGCGLIAVAGPKSVVGEANEGCCWKSLMDNAFWWSG